MKLARTIRFDESDGNVFEHAADSGEWCVSGAFAFSDWTDDDLTGKKRQAFRNGWLSVETFGRSTFVATAEIEQSEIDSLAMALAAHFVREYGAPGMDAALPVAEEELRHMAELCEEHDPNTLLVVERNITDAGIHETFRTIKPAEASVVDVLGPMADHAVEMSRVKPEE